MASSRTKSSFFVLSPSRGSAYDTQLVKAEPIHRGQAPVCPVCGSFVGMKAWLPPRKAELVLNGDYWGDFAFVSRSEFGVSEAVARAVENESIKGVPKLERMQIIGDELPKGSDQPPSYFYWTVTRSRAAVDESASDITRTEIHDCDECLSDGLSAVRGFHLDASSWSGEDVFVARGLPGLVIATEVFRDVARRYEFKNVKFIPTASFRWEPLRQQP